MPVVFMENIKEVPRSNIAIAQCPASSWAIVFIKNALFFARGQFFPYVTDLMIHDYLLSGLLRQAGGGVVLDRPNTSGLFFVNRALCVNFKLVGHFFFCEISSIMAVVIFFEQCHAVIARVPNIVSQASAASFNFDNFHILSPFMPPFGGGCYYLRYPIAEINASHRLSISTSDSLTTGSLQDRLYTGMIEIPSQL